MRRRVVITGAGVVSPIGAGVADFWDALAAGRSGAAHVELEAVGTICGFPVTEGEDARERFGQRDARRMDRAGRFAAVAGALALEDAGTLGIEPERIGVSVGSVHGGADTLLEAHRAFLERGPDRVGPLSIPLSLANHPCASVARVLGLRGPTSSPATACAAGSDAIGAALSLLREGRADAMIAGGSDAPLSPLVIAGYQRVGALSPSTRPPGESSSPFDVARDGFVMGEGAGVLLLEEREHALARGARIYAELTGYGSSCDAGHLTDPDATGEGPSRAMAIAIADAGLTPADVGYVNAHATSTMAGDIAESRALTRAGLGGAAISSTKSAHGHALGGAGGVEAVATLMAFARDLLPATLNLRDPDPEAPFDHVLEPRAVQVAHAASNSFGFGGHNACLVLSRHTGA
ncbi:beta-ketoacyl-[acyl-carrier-protein] synthase family protein [Miltoncostaea oceani]|uniref:beta-ketoacyl-[acyl-carrier-protein] synthase family protein n=1 Tax=Miltoncostaea oceani TaxID=2843216 RepID=UPI001C3E29AE|nr:beta-ketoacyl-[acyl-carrier-protein] synthase family protein [Miltoncostaea oceani]